MMPFVVVTLTMMETTTTIQNKRNIQVENGLEKSFSHSGIHLDVQTINIIFYCVFFFFLCVSLFQPSRKQHHKDLSLYVWRLQSNNKKV